LKAPFIVIKAAPPYKYKKQKILSQKIIQSRNSCRNKWFI